MHYVLEFNQSQLLKHYVEFNAQKKQKSKKKSRKKWCQRWKRLVQINEQCCIWKKMGNLRHRIDVKLVSNKKDCLKWTSKPNFMSYKIFDNDLVAIRKSKVTLMLNKPASLECVLWN